MFVIPVVGLRQMVSFGSNATMESIRSLPKSVDRGRDPSSVLGQ